MVQIPPTLFQLASANTAPGTLARAALVLIDYQNDYLAGPLALTAVEPALAAAAELLAAARRLGAPILHVAHRGRPGGLFDRQGTGGRIIAALAPREEEPVIEKTLVNAFTGTDLHHLLTAAGRPELILSGFMTHNCVSSTARGALDLGYRTTVFAPGCATRPLPDGRGGILAAEQIHQAALAELSDRTAMIAWSAGEVGGHIL